MIISIFYLIYLVEFLFYHEISLKNKYKKLNCIHEIAIFKHNIQYYLKYFFTELVLFIIYKSDYYYYSQIHIIWNYLLEHQTWYEDLRDKNISSSKLKFQMCIIQTKFCETRTQGMLKRENLNAIATGERFLRAA